jgi:hypothetical protein
MNNSQQTASQINHGSTCLSQQHSNSCIINQQQNTITHEKNWAGLSLA